MFVLGVVALLQQAVAPQVPPTRWFQPGVYAGNGYEVTSAGSVLDTVGATLTLKSVGAPTSEATVRGTEPIAAPITQVRLSGEIKTTNAPDGASLWLRVNDPRGRMMKLDNGQTRAVKGTTDWTHFETTLPVPQGAKDLAFGVLFWGTGVAEVRRLRLETIK